MPSPMLRIARHELRSLEGYVLQLPRWEKEPRTWAKVVGLLREMIEVSDDVRRTLDAFCVVHPEDAEEIYAALELRERMLKLL